MALRLPRHVAQDARLAEGVPVEVAVKDGTVVITPVRKKFKLDDLLAQMKPEHRHNETEWGEARGDETW